MFRLPSFSQYWGWAYWLLTYLNIFWTDVEMEIVLKRLNIIKYRFIITAECTFHFHKHQLRVFILCKLFLILHTFQVWSNYGLSSATPILFCFSLVTLLKFRSAPWTMEVGAILSCYSLQEQSISWYGQLLSPVWWDSPLSCLSPWQWNCLPLHHVPLSDVST